MKMIRTQLFRAIVITTLLSSCVYLAYGKESPNIYIVRNVAWNAFLLFKQTVCVSSWPLPIWFGLLFLQVRSSAPV
jgi:hypothetical protein